MRNHGCLKTMVAEEKPTTDQTADASGDPNIVRIANKLGTFEFDRKLSLNFPTGVIGFPDIHEFGLASLPADSMAEFRLLQCITEPRISFIVLPMDPAAAPIDPLDIQEACQTLGITPENLVMFFIITIRSAGPGAGITMSINHRAPVMVDSATRMGRQYVLSSNKYSVQHQIS